MLKIYKFVTDPIEVQLPFVSNLISAGFPSPAEDYIEEVIDLNQVLIQNPSSTFLGRVTGVSMIDAGIYPDDILIIDKSLGLRDKGIAVCYVNGEFTMKRIVKDKMGLWLMPENKNYSPILITPDNESFMIWGIVSWIIKKAR